jgi:hypothetical protein
LYYASAADNAALLNIQFNGVSAECWSPINYIPFDSPITKLVGTASGLLVFTTTDIWVVIGQDLTTFYPSRIFAGHGLLSVNALSVDGSTIYAQLADKQFISLNPSAGSIEIGFPIGDQIDANISPALSYVTRHLGGSEDNAIFLADGSTGWYRLNPNQVGASLSGEQTPVWSPFATIVGGCGAVKSVQTTAGANQLLVGQTSTGPVLVRDLAVFTDNGETYTWNAIIGSIVLANSGQLAVTESITTEFTEASVTQPEIGVILDEIAGTFEELPLSVNDPPQLNPSTSILSQRFYLSQGTDPPLCKHCQIQLTGAAATTKDELLSLTIRGQLVAEQ